MLGLQLHVIARDASDRDATLSYIKQRLQTGVDNQRGALQHHGEYQFSLLGEKLKPVSGGYVKLSLTGGGSTPPPTPVVIDPYVVSFAQTITAAGGTVSQSDQEALTLLYQDLISTGYWNKIKCLYVFTPGSIASTFNFRDVTTFRLTLVGGITSGPDGLTSDGTGYYNTGFIPETHASGVDNLAFDVFEDVTTPQGLGYSLGVSDYSGAHQIGIYRSAVSENHSGTIAYMSSGTGGEESTAFLLNAETALTLQRSAGGRLSLYQYGRKVHEITSAADGLSGQGFPVFGMAKNNFGGPNSIMTGTHKHLVIRDALPDTDVQHLYTLLHLYHIRTGRSQKIDSFHGDSITHALNVENSWARLYTRQTGTYMVNYAVSGQVGYDFVDTLANSQIPLYDARIHNQIFFAFGTNDILASTTAQDFADNVVEGAAYYALQQGWPASKMVFIPAFYQRGDNAGVIRQQYQTAAEIKGASLNMRVLNMYQALKIFPGVDTNLFPSGDGTHYNQPGAQVVADKVILQLTGSL